MGRVRERVTIMAAAALAAVLGVAGGAWAQPANDNCADAISLTVGVPASYSSCDATLDGPGFAECDPGMPLRDVWFSYTFESAATATLTLENGGTPAFVEVYSGTCGSLGTPLACTSGSTLSFFGGEGATLLIRVGSLGEGCGGETITITSLNSGRAVPTGFTYQGQIAAGGVPLNGAANFAFRLFDAPSAGTQVGATVYHQGLNVSGGLLTTLLDFGAGVCDGNDRWLEITVNGTALSPRQELTATPYALYALSAGTAAYAASAGSAASATHADNGGSGGVFIESFSRPSMGDAGYNSNPNAFVPVVQTDKVVSLPAGKAVFDWTLPGMSTGSNRVVQLRANIAGVLGPTINYQFGAAFTELPMSGHIVVTIPEAVTGTVRLEVKVPSPSGGALWYPGAGSPNGGVNGNGTGMSWTLVVYKD